MSTALHSASHPGTCWIEHHKMHCRQPGLQSAPLWSRQNVTNLKEYYGHAKCFQKTGRGYRYMSLLAKWNQTERSIILLCPNHVLLWTKIVFSGHPTSLTSFRFTSKHIRPKVHLTAASSETELQYCTCARGHDRSRWSINSLSKGMVVSPKEIPKQVMETSPSSSTTRRCGEKTSSYGC